MVILLSRREICGMQSIDYDEIFKKVMKENMWKELLCGERGLTIPFDPFAAPPYGTPTVVGSVLDDFFYNRYEEYPEVKAVLYDTLLEMSRDNVSHLYISVLYLNEYYRSIKYKWNKFTLNTDDLINSIQNSICLYSESLKKSITFQNGDTEPNPMKIIQIISETLEQREGIRLL